MIEFAVVLLIKRAIELQKKKKSKIVFDCNRKEHVDKMNSTEGQNEFLLKEKKSHANEAQHDIESNYRNEKHEKELLYSTTDVIDFVSLLVYLTCYVTFNCIYMTFYIS